MEAKAGNILDTRVEWTQGGLAYENWQPGINYSIGLRATFLNLPSPRGNIPWWPLRLCCFARVPGYNSAPPVAACCRHCVPFV